MDATVDTPGQREDHATAVALAWARFWLTMAFALVATLLAFSWFMVGFALRAKPRWAYRCGYWWGRGILWAAGCPVSVEFTAPPPEGGFFYYSNHQGILDIFALFAVLDRTPFVFAAKRGLFYVPAIGWYLRLANYVEVDRSNRERAVASYARAARQVQAGTVLTVYPEGTRSVDGSVLPFKKGAFVLAIEAQRPIVPVAVEGAQLALRKHTLRLFGHPIRVRVGAPISTAGLTLDDRDALLRRTRLAVLELHRQIGGPRSPEEPMIAPPGKQSGARESCGHD
jgi:1-acyl-sn-glycerol-3-phosphate acyltransferase